MKALVVGGSSGIGLACVELLLAQGHEVIVGSRDATRVKHLPITHVELDVLEGVDVLTQYDDIGALIYAPGSIQLKPFKRLTQEDFLADFHINVLGAVKVIQAVAPALANKQGSVVMFSTVAAKQGMGFHASVATSKAAVEGLCLSLAAEYAPKIRFNAVAPSLSDTALAAQLLSSEQKQEAAANRHPLKRIGRPEDAAQMAVSLIQPDTWITGQVIGVDGGLSTLR